MQQDDKVAVERAFPSASYGCAGMSLRDYFAAKAMQYFLSSYVDDDLGIDRVAVLAYAAADAMMKAREEQ